MLYRTTIWSRLPPDWAELDKRVVGGAPAGDEDGWARGEEAEGEDGVMSPVQLPDRAPQHGHRRLHHGLVHGILLRPRLPSLHIDRRSKGLHQDDGDKDREGRKKHQILVPRERRQESIGAMEPPLTWSKLSPKPKLL
jgi:hypothetical protein